MSECQAVRRNGHICNAQAREGSKYCYFHDPTREAERRAARRLGGLRRGSHGGDTGDLPLKVRDMEGVLALLDYIRAELASLDNGVARARVLVSLAGEYRSSIEMGDIERRLSALEEAQGVSKK